MMKPANFWSRNFTLTFGWIANCSNRLFKKWTMWNTWTNQILNLKLIHLCTATHTCNPNSSTYSYKILNQLSNHWNNDKTLKQQSIFKLSRMQNQKKKIWHLEPTCLHRIEFLGILKNIFLKVAKIEATNMNTHKSLL